MCSQITVALQKVNVKLSWVGKVKPTFMFTQSTELFTYFSLKSQGAQETQNYTRESRVN
jgi:hypothetical protein